MNWSLAQVSEEVEWQIKLDAIDVNNILSLDDETLLVSTVGFVLGDRMTKELVSISKSTGEINWKKPQYGGENFIPLLSEPHLIGLYTYSFSDGILKAYSIAAVDKQGEKIWNVDIRATSFHYVVFDEEILAWSYLDGNWSLTKLSLSDGSFYTKKLSSPIDRFNSVYAVNDLLFLFGFDRMVVFDSIRSNSYPYPSVLNSVASGVIEANDGYLIGIGESLFKWDPDMQLTPIINDKPAIIAKYNQIEQSLVDEGILLDDFLKGTLELGTKGKKAASRLAKVSRAYERVSQERTLSGMVRAGDFVLVSFKNGDNHMVGMIDLAGNLLSKGTTDSKIHGNAILVGSDIFFPSEKHLYKWNTETKKIDQVFALGSLTIDPIDLYFINGSILVSGRTGYILIDPNALTIKSTRIVNGSFLIPGGYYAFKEELIRARLNGSGGVFTNPPIVVSNNLWRERNIELEQQIQKEPYRRNSLVQQKMLNTTIGMSFDKMYTSMSLVNASMALAEAVQASQDKDLLEDLISGKRIAEQVITSEPARRLKGDFYFLPEFDNGWYVNICNLKSGEFARVLIATFDELRLINTDTFFSYYLNEDQNQVVLKVDDNTSSYNSFAYYKRPKGFMAGTNDASFPNSKLVAIDLDRLNWKPTSSAMPKSREIPDLRLIQSVKRRDVEQVKTLLDEEVDIDARDKFGMSAFLWAVALDDPKIVDLILKAEPDGSVQDVKGWTAFTYLEVLTIGTPRANPIKITGRVKKDLKK